MPDGQSTRLPRRCPTPSQRTALEPLRALALRPAERLTSLDEVVAPPVRRDLAGRPRGAAAPQRPLRRAAGAARHEPRPPPQLLHEWRRDGVLVRDAEPALWWHEQRFTGPDGVDRSRAGFFSAVRLSPYEEGRVRPHEHTHAHGRAGAAGPAPRHPYQPLADPRALRRPGRHGRARRWRASADRPTRTCRRPTATAPSTASGRSPTRRRSRAVAGGAGRPRDPDRRRPPPLRDGARLPRRAARAPTAIRRATGPTTSC